MYYFYCPKCGFEKEVKVLPKNTVLNVRDGYGMPINHFGCKMCGNLDAGFMYQKFGDMDEKVYYRSVISLYQKSYDLQQIIEN